MSGVEEKVIDLPVCTVMKGKQTNKKKVKNGDEFYKLRESGCSEIMPRGRGPGRFIQKETHRASRVAQ